MEPEDAVTRIREELEEELDVDQVIVFGSRVRRTHHADSDWDVAVVSSDFTEMRFPERQRAVRRLVRNALGVVPLDVVCYTPEEYEQGQDGFLPEIIEEEGVRA